MQSDLAEYREELLAGPSGRIIEIGAGNGLNFSHYPAAVEQVIAHEPEAYLRDRAHQAARHASVNVSVGGAVADSLPLDAGAFDAAVASLVLCTVPDAAAALAELRRVRGPGGELRFLEHVRSERPSKARFQSWLDRSGIWPMLGGGCHCARDSLGAIERAGFAIERVRSFDLGPRWVVTNPHLLGIRRSPVT